MDYNRPKLFFNDFEELWIFGYRASIIWILFATSLSVLHLFCTSTEALLWIQLVAEGSLSFSRTFDKTTPKVREVNDEPSLFHFIHTIVSIDSHDCFSQSTRLFQSIHTIVSVNPHDCFRQTIMPLVCNDKKMLLNTTLRSIFDISCI